jgi:hypothetical protein
MGCLLALWGWTDTVYIGVALALKIEKKNAQTHKR